MTVSVSEAWAAPPPDPPDESCFSWWPPPDAAAEVAVVVVVVLVAVGAGVALVLHATESTPAATAVMPTLRDARLRIWAVINDNGLSLPRKVTIGQRDSYLPASDRHQNRYVELAVSPLS